ncbi:MAG: hypothetical protein QUS33_13900 [Dehalococcoidia bacterium]|nr:hypothetical protein [Dehalococcoidia bacterium]
MGLFVSIIRWTPEQAEAVKERMMSVANGTAPKAVMDAIGKMKYLADVISPQNGFELAILDVSDETWVDGSLLADWMGEVATLESYPVCSWEHYLEVQKRRSDGGTPKKSRRK